MRCCPGDGMRLSPSGTWQESQGRAHRAEVTCQERNACSCPVIFTPHCPSGEIKQDSAEVMEALSLLPSTRVLSSKCLDTCFFLLHTSEALQLLLGAGQPGFLQTDHALLAQCLQQALALKVAAAGRGKTILFTCSLSVDHMDSPPRGSFC